MVLRVHVTRVFVPASASTTRAVALAIPLRWHRKLSATHSAVKMAPAGPRTVAMTSPADKRLPSGFCAASAMSGETSRNCECDQIQPGHDLFGNLSRTTALPEAADRLDDLVG